MASSVNEYSMSFTAASLLPAESLALADAYAETRDWERTKEQALRENLIQKRSYSSIKRQVPELIKRLTNLSDPQIEQLVSANDHEQKYILWLAVCKTYPFLKEFAQEIMYEHYHAFNNCITPADVRAFFDSKAIIHPRLQDLSVETQKKVISETMTLLRQSGLISEKNEILPLFMTAALEVCLSEEDEEYRRIYPC
ncbi:MAG: DUF1819 family protein [Flexilinea sp.]|nr:DUF1819 family protein [Flexilinea sp.]